MPPDGSRCQCIATKGHQQSKATDEGGDRHHQTQGRDSLGTLKLRQNDGIECGCQLPGSRRQDRSYYKALQSL